MKRLYGCLVQSKNWNRPKRDPPQHSFALTQSRAARRNRGSAGRSRCAVLSTRMQLANGIARLSLASGMATWSASLFTSRTALPSGKSDPFTTGFGGRLISAALLGEHGQFCRRPHGLAGGLGVGDLLRQRLHQRLFAFGRRADFQRVVVP